MIARQVVNRFAHQTDTDLHQAQQDVVLLYGLGRLHQSGILDRLIFKGGTHLRKMILGNQGRFSEDLDFTNNGLDGDLRAVFEDALGQEHHGVRFAVREPYGTLQGNWACTVEYAHAWDRGSFDLQISSREKAFLPSKRMAPLQQIYFPDLPFAPPEIPCMQLPEAIAEKLRAVHQRSTERDLYDAIQYARKGFDPALVRLLAVAKLWNEREPFDPEKILAMLEQGRQDWPDLRNLLGRRDRTDWNAECRNAAARFAFLRDLTDFEQRLIKDYRRHDLAPDLEELLGRWRS